LQKENLIYCPVLVNHYTTATVSAKCKTPTVKGKTKCRRREGRQ
jgi:hypothetical protein